MYESEPNETEGMEVREREPETSGVDVQAITEEAVRRLPEKVRKLLIKVQGGRDYLTVAGRLLWLREEHPDWGIETNPVVADIEKGVFIFHAVLRDGEGKIISSGTKMETVRGFADACEKSETGAIGRALGAAGYGTEFMLDELNEGQRIVDSPARGNGGYANQRGNRQSGGQGGGRPQGGRPANVDEDGVVQDRPARHTPQSAAMEVPGISVGFAVCADCGRPLTKGQTDYSTVRFGAPLCPSHQSNRTPADAAGPGGQNRA